MNSPADLPPAFEPVIRIWTVNPGTSKDDYARDVVAKLMPYLNDDQATQYAKMMCADPIPVADPDKLPRMIGGNGRFEPTILLVTQVESRVRQLFETMPDTLERSYLTLTQHQSEDIQPGTVVWLRYGSAALTEFIFPKLWVELTQEGGGQWSELTATVVDDPKNGSVPVPEAAPSAPVDADGVEARGAEMALAAETGPTALEVASGAVEVVGTLVWALPPPWSALSATVLTAVGLFLRKAGEQSGESPLSTLTTNLEQFMRNMRLQDQAQTVRHFSDDLLNHLVDFTMDPRAFPAMPTQVMKDFEDWFQGYQGYGITTLDATVDHMIGDLELQPTLEAGMATLTAACGALALYATAQKVWMQYNACKLKAQLNAKLLTDYADGKTSFRIVYDRLKGKLFGVPSALHPGQMSTQGYATRITAWIDKMKTERLAKVTATERAAKQEWVCYTGTMGGSCAPSWKRGWRFVDQQEGDEWAHFMRDTIREIDACHAETVDHKTDVEQARTAWLTQVTKAFDDQTQKARDSIQGLTDRLKEIAQMLPPAAPKDNKITVTLKTSGAPAGQTNIWTKGAQVWYQVAFANGEGRGDLGPATAAYMIGDFAGATLTNLPTDPNAQFIRIVRTIAPSPEMPRIVRELAPVAMADAGKPIEDIP